jgi:hypothetical protein
MEKWVGGWVGGWKAVKKIVKEVDVTDMREEIRRALRRLAAGVKDSTTMKQNFPRTVDDLDNGD